VLWDGTRTSVLLEGDPRDVGRESAAAGLTTVDQAPSWPSAQHRGRISIAPGRVSELGSLLASSTDVDWLAEIGVGTVHVGADHEDDLRAARDVTERLGGWLLREHGAPGLDGFGRPLPNAALSARVKEAFDPTGKLAPGRMEFVDARSPAAGEQVEVSRG
jgi:hypothetical protein